jgi:hypothetical protein
MSCPKGKCEAELFGSNRIYDVAINDYTGSNINPEEAEYKFSIDEWKYRHLKKDLSNIVFNYKACAFFDDDVCISAEDINKLFLLGESLNLNIWQASLTKDSYSSWQHLYVRENSHVRLTNEIELMMPFFSKSALQICFDTFDANYCAWGIECVWGVRLNYDKICVVDSIPVKHVRPICSGSRIMPNGMTPHQEAHMVFAKYGISKPTNIY